jgi:catechol 2,3-dioxygenase-like lactoylglutathione lyase family enzyme
MVGSLRRARGPCQIRERSYVGDLTGVGRADELWRPLAADRARFVRPREENDILGFTSGPRPAFSFPGAWLYNDGKAVLHVVQRPSIPEGGGVLDHIAFFGTDPSAYVAKLKARGMKYDLRRLPENGHAGGLWQLFFFDPSGARVEIDFAASETVEGEG